MTYEAEKPTLPIRLTPVGTSEDLSITTWIFADTAYTASNYAHGTVDWSAIRLQQSWQYFEGDVFGEFSLERPRQFVDRFDEYDRIQAQYEGKAFVNEATLSTEEVELRLLLKHAYTPPALMDLLAQFFVVTRMRIQLSPEQMTQDIEFTPTSGFERVDNIIRLSDYVDPIITNGCSSEHILSPEIMNMFPAETINPELGIALGHPIGWELVKLTHQHRNIYALTSQPMTEPEILDVLREKMIPLYYLL